MHLKLSSVSLLLLHAKQLLHQLVRHEPNAVLGHYLQRIGPPALKKAAQSFFGIYLVKCIQLSLIYEPGHLHAAADCVERKANGGSKGTGYRTDDEVGDGALLTVEGSNE